MGKHEPIPLRESRQPFAPDAEVVDVEFTEVTGARRTILGRFRAALQALLWAAVIGFLVPPAWVMIQILGDIFRQS